MDILLFELNMSKIMIIDDDPLILRVISKLLKKIDVETESFEDESLALSKFKNFPTEYALILSDLKLQNLTGIELFYLIREINPNQKMVLTSGFGYNSEIEKLIDKGLIAFLEKPYGLEKLKTVFKKVFPDKEF